MPYTFGDIDKAPFCRYSRGGRVGFQLGTLATHRFALLILGAAGAS
jgi:hypothetical protein